METVLLIIGAGIVLTGGLVRLLKSGTLNAELEARGLPTVPKRALPYLSLFIGLVYAILVELQMRGLEAWKEAVVYGLLEGLGVGGGASYFHDLGRAVPGVREKLGFVLVIGGLAGVLPGCAWFQKRPQLVKTFAEKSACALTYINFPKEQIIELCELAPEDWLEILPLLAASRANAAAQAAAARADEAARHVGAPLCADAGAQ